MGRLLTGAVLLAGCGRLGFGDLPPAGDTPDAPATPAAAKLACGGPTRFELGAASVTALAVASDDNGFAVFAADSTGALRGDAYTFAGDQLGAGTTVPIDSGVTGAIGATTAGGRRMLTSMNGMPTATGTSVFALDPALSEVATTSVRANQFAADGPIATSASGTTAFVTIDGSTTEVDVHALAADGSDAGAPVKIIDGLVGANNVSIAPAGSGFVVSYGTGSPNQVTLLLLDDAFAVTAGPMAVDTASGSEYRPHVAWANDCYGVAWHAKNASDGDDVWFEELDSHLAVVRPQGLIGANAANPTLAADDNGFWLAWQDYSTMTTILNGAHVAFDGEVTPRAVTSSGGSPGAWVMTSRAGQAVLAWTEVGGSGPDLYLDPMCP